MISMIRKLTALAAFLAMGLLGTSARADLTVTVQEGTGTIFTLVNITGAPGTPTNDPNGAGSVAATPDYKVTLQSAEANQTSTLSELLSAAVSITNITGVAGKVLHITITGSGYTNPTGSVGVLSHIGGTVSVEGASSTDSLVFHSIVGGTNLGPQTPAINGGPGSFQNDLSGTASLSSPFTMQQTLNITLNALNDQIGYQGSTTLGVPEPSTMAIAGLGALGMIGYGLRRRKALGA